MSANPLPDEPTVQIQFGVQRYGLYPDIMLRNRGGKPFAEDELAAWLRHIFDLTEKQAATFVEKVRVEAPELLGGEARR